MSVSYNLLSQCLESFSGVLSLTVPPSLCSTSSEMLDVISVYAGRFYLFLDHFFRFSLLCLWLILCQFIIRAFPHLLWIFPVSSVLPAGPFQMPQNARFNTELQPLTFPILTCPLFPETCLLDRKHLPCSPGSSHFRDIWPVATMTLY